MGGPVWTAAGGDWIDRTQDGELHFRSVRLNRAAGGWDADVVVSNRSARAISGRLWLILPQEGSEVQWHDRDLLGCVDNPVTHWDLSAMLPEGGLAPGACSRPKRLTLMPADGRGRGEVQLLSQLWELPEAGLIKDGSREAEGAPAQPTLEAGGGGEVVSAVVTPPTVLRTNILTTGLGLPLASLEFSVRIPDTLPRPSLSFLFGFATQEPDVPGVLFDSMSVTVQSTELSSTALLLTADVTGVQWAPPNPGGINISQGRVVRTPIAFPDLGVDYPSRRAFSSLYAVNPELAGRDAVVYVDLFDNDNASQSLAFFIGPGIRPGFVAVESSSLVSGPYAVESAARFDLAGQTITLGHVPDTCFFRLQSEREVRISGFGIVNQSMVFDYQFSGAPSAEGDAPPALESSAAAAGPYAAEPGTVAEAGLSRLRLPLLPRVRFYRLQSEIPLRITRTTLNNGRVVLSYDEP